MEDEHEEMDGDDVNPMNDPEDGEDRTRDNFVAAGLEDSDAEEDMGAHSNRKRRAWSESDEEDDQPSEPNPNSSSGRDRENSRLEVIRKKLMKNKEWLCVATYFLLSFPSSLKVRHRVQVCILDLRFSDPDVQLTGSQAQSSDRESLIQILI
ncbi:uncharacterized protein A4U43_C06F9770 [Asparagus officinalis]|uniref:Uncharacterized protein n=1 Tax=Asparagus officinalis TaxID=4686 RepID=A0A5P1EL08_ASPOF|nr:uncharacterized protein A4U43_C06F9770 [Asparagus officinalis]